MSSSSAAPIVISPESPFSDLYLGIDAGGTKTSCALIDRNGLVWGQGAGPAGNFFNTEPGAVAAAVLQARDEALAASNSSPQRIAAAAICLAGFDPAKDENRARALLDPVLSPARTVYGRDLDAALAAVCGSGPGLVVIAGTGSVAFGRGATGATARAGGWGYMVGDEGSGFWLGSQAIRHTMQAFDGRAAKGVLFDKVCEKSNTTNALDLEGRVYHERWTPAIFAGYAPLVFDAAGAGDPTALRLVETAAAELCAQALAVIRRLDLTTAKCGLVGSLWNAGPLLREPFERALRQNAPGITPVTPAITPSEGAALLALAAAGVDVQPEQVRRR